MIGKLYFQYKIDNYCLNNIIYSYGNIEVNYWKTIFLSKWSRQQLGRRFFFVLFHAGFLISEGDSGVMLKRKKESGICTATKKKKKRAFEGEYEMCRGQRETEIKILTFMWL